MIRSRLSLMIVLVLVTCLPTICAADVAEPPLLPTGSVAPDFTAVGMDGKALHLSDFRGKIVVLDFWASWCPPCNEMMPGIESLYEKYNGKGVKVLGLNVWDDADPAYSWIQAHPQYRFIFAHDTAGAASRSMDPSAPVSISKRFLVPGIPTTYVIDPSGRVVFADVVAQDDALSTAIDGELTMLNSPPNMNDGESLFTGTVTKAYDGVSTIEMGADSMATSTSDTTTTFTPARIKTINIGDQTSITIAGVAVRADSLAIGAKVFVVGKDGGKGKALVARIITSPLTD